MHLVLGNSRRWVLGPLIYSCSTSTSVQGSDPLANRSVQNILQERSCFKEVFGSYAECIRNFFSFQYDKWVSNEREKMQACFPRAIKKSEQHLQVNGAMGKVYLLLMFVSCSPPLLAHFLSCRGRLGLVYYIQITPLLVTNHKHLQQTRQLRSYLAWLNIFWHLETQVIFWAFKFFSGNPGKFMIVI